MAQAPDSSKPTEGASLKAEIFALVQEAVSASEQQVRRNAEKLQEALDLHLSGQLTEKEFLFEIEERRAIMEQFLNTRKIKQGARLEQLTLGLLDKLQDGIRGKIF